MAHPAGQRQRGYFAGLYFLVPVRHDIEAEMGKTRKTPLRIRKQSSGGPVLAVGAQAGRHQRFAPAPVLPQHVVKHLAPALRGFLGYHAGCQRFGGHSQQRTQKAATARKPLCT